MKKKPLPLPTLPSYDYRKAKLGDTLYLSPAHHMYNTLIEQDLTAILKNIKLYEYAEPTFQFSLTYRDGTNYSDSRPLWYCSYPSSELTIDPYSYEYLYYMAYQDLDKLYPGANPTDITLPKKSWLSYESRLRILGVFIFILSITWFTISGITQ